MSRMKLADKMNVFVSRHQNITHSSFSVQLLPQSDPGHSKSAAVVPQHCTCCVRGFE